MLVPTQYLQSKPRKLIHLWKGWAGLGWAGLYTDLHRHKSWPIVCPAPLQVSTQIKSSWDRGRGWGYLISEDVWASSSLPLHVWSSYFTPRWLPCLYSHHPISLLHLTIDFLLQTENEVVVIVLNIEYYKKSASIKVLFATTTQLHGESSVSTPIKFWSSDFHISPVEDAKLILSKYHGVSILDKSLSGHCHLTHTCAENLHIISTFLYLLFSLL